jgi:hypothetical protein
MNQLLRLSRAYVTSMAVTANSPKSINPFIRYSFSIGAVDSSGQFQ